MIYLEEATQNIMYLCNTPSSRKPISIFQLALRRKNMIKIALSTQTNQILKAEEGKVSLMCSQPKRSIALNSCQLYSKKGFVSLLIFGYVKCERSKHA